MTVANRPLMEPELRTILGRHRDELLRRALAIAVSRASLEELAERPLGDRLDELELVFEAATPGPVGGAPSRADRVRDLQDELDHQLRLHAAGGRVFSVAVIVGGRARIARLDDRDDVPAPVPDARAWTHALRACGAPGDVIIDAGDGAIAVVLPDHDSREAKVAAERLCRSAWHALGEQGPIPGAGVAAFPEDGETAAEILAAAYDALWRQAEFSGPGDAQPAPEPPQDDRPPAPVHPLRLL